MVNRAKKRSGIDPLTYMGIEPDTASLLIVETRTPTEDDRARNQIGAVWIVEETDDVAGRIFALVRLEGSGPSGTATWKELDSGFGGETFQTDSGVAIPAASIINIIGGTSTGGVTTNMNTRGAGNTVEVNLDNSIFQPTTNASGLEGLYALGGSNTAFRFMHNFGDNGVSDHNTFLGGGAGNFTLTASNSVGVGFNSLISLTSGTDNCALGAFSQDAMLTGSKNISLGTNSLGAELTGSNSVVIGDGAAILQNAGFENVIIGNGASANTVTGNTNTILGFEAFSTSPGNSSSNVAVGWKAMGAGASHSSAIGIGYNALGTSGSINTTVAIGFRVMQTAVNTTLQSVIIGTRTCEVIDTGHSITALGHEALQNATTGHTGTVCVGHQALRACTTQTGVNTAIGYRSLNAITTGTNNLGLGSLAGSALATTDSDNILVANTGTATDNNTIRFGTTGAGAGQQNRFFMGGITDTSGTIEPPTTGGLRYLMFVVPDTEQVGTHTPQSLGAGPPVPLARTYGDNNLFFGRASGNETLTTGGAGAVRNVGLGTRTLNGLTTGDDNCAHGTQALQNINSGIGNCAYGSESLNDVTSGAENSGYGSSALELITTGSRNVAIGIDAGASLATSDSDNFMVLNNGTATDNNTVRIGAGTGTGNKQFNKVFFSGIRGITTGVVDAIAVLIDSAGQLGTTSSSARFKDNIRDMADDSSAVMKLRPVTFSYKEDGDQKLQYGLIAEEVEEYMPRLVSYDEDGLPYTVRYNEIPAILLNEIQKLEKRLERLENISCTSCGHHVG